MPPTKTTPAASARPEPRRGAAPEQDRGLGIRGQRTMRRLLDAGVEVFAAHGYHNARVDDVVRTAETSHGTFYLYFANKEDLFATIVAEVAGEMRHLAHALGPLSPDRAGYEALRTWLTALVDLHQRHGPIIRAWTEAEVCTSGAGRLGTDVLGALALAVADKIVDPTDDIDPTIASIALVAMVERFNYFVEAGLLDATRDQAVDLLADTVHAALFGTDARHREP